MRSCASRSARPGSPGSRTRSATGSCGLRITGASSTGAHSSYDRHDMAKKDKKKDKSKDDDSARTGAVDAIEAVRAVVEKTFAEGAQSTRERAADIVMEVAQAAASVRGLLEDMRVADDVRALRADVEALSARVTALERAATAATTASPAAAPATATAAPAPRSTAPRASGTTASRASRSTAGTEASGSTAGSSGTTSSRGS